MSTNYRIHLPNLPEERDAIIGILGKTVGILTSREELEAYQEGKDSHIGPLWGKLSLISFQEDGIMAALRGGSFIEVFAVVEPYEPASAYLTGGLR